MHANNKCTVRIYLCFVIIKTVNNLLSHGEQAYTLRYDICDMINSSRGYFDIPVCVKTRVILSCVLIACLISVERFVVYILYTIPDSILRDNCVLD